MGPKAEVWVIPAQQVVLLTDLPGPPMQIVGFVSRRAKRAAERRGVATVSELCFPADCFLGSFPLPEGGSWGEAMEVAQAKARELGYRVHCGSVDITRVVATDHLAALSEES